MKTVHSTLLLLGLALLPGTARAFCGTFVGAPGTTLTNTTSRVVLARHGTHTTLTVAADYAGDASSFAMLLPIPEVIGPEDVTTGDPTLIDWLDQYSTPRAVAYTCDDVFDVQQSGMGCGTLMGCADYSLASPSGLTGAAGELADDSVAVESTFSAAGYDFVVLSAEESGDLFTWLRVNGYEVPRGGDAILQEYIDAGVYFLAAKVSMDAVPSSNTWLPPLQISYDSDTFGLPIRIGTISSDGEQDTLIYALTDMSLGGEVGISNYPEVTLDDECMWQPDADEDLTTWYSAQVSDAVDAAGGAAWVKEYSADLVPSSSGAGYHCDPCTATPAIPGGTFAPFGLPGNSAHLTRMRLRYTPDTAVSDATLYLSGITGVSEQLRYISYVKDLEYLYPVCNSGWVSDPGECANASPSAAGCNAPSIRATGLGVLAALAILRRRRA